MAVVFALQPVPNQGAHTREDLFSIALGSYSAVSLKAERNGRDSARKTREGGTDPVVQQRKADKLAATTNSATTFKAVAREFHAGKLDDKTEQLEVIL